jgi:hypothetical protein
MIIALRPPDTAGPLCISATGHDSWTSSGKSPNQVIAAAARLVNPTGVVVVASFYPEGTSNRNP